MSFDAGAKLFYLSGMRHGKYLQREVHNLARFISVMKFRPLSWRTAHPYLLTDRFEVHAQLTQRFWAFCPWQHSTSNSHKLK